LHEGLWRPPLHQRWDATAKATDATTRKWVKNGAFFNTIDPEPTDTSLRAKAWGYADFPLENCQSVQHSETKTMSTNLGMDNYAFTAILTRA
jgi:hypothetical protein